MIVSVRELKGGLSRYLKRAAAGEDITVTSRGQPIVRLLPAPVPSAVKEPSAAEVRRRLMQVPGIILGKAGKPKGSARPTRVRTGQKQVSDIVIEDRR